MATRSALFILDHTGDWLRIYCHYDGYPEHMMPALQNARAIEIAEAREIRGIQPDGSVDGFEQPRSPARAPFCEPAMPEWAEHAYILTATGWHHATDTTELRRLATA